MSQEELYKKAYERERSARESAEQLLDEKSREIYANMVTIKEQYVDLEQRKNNMELLLTVSKFTQEEKSFADSISEFSEILRGFTHALFVKPRILKQGLSRTHGSIEDLNQVSKLAVSKGSPVSLEKDKDINNLYMWEKNKELSGLHAIPINCYSETVAVIEIGIVIWDKFPKSLRNSASIAASQLGMSLERRVSSKELEMNHKKLSQAHQSLKKAQQQLVNSEKLASIGQLAAGVAHEINNPIGFVISNMNTLGEYIQTLTGLISKYEMIRKSVNEQQKLDEILKEIEDYREEEDLDFLLEDIGDMLDESSNGLVRVKDIVSSLKNFARMGSDNKTLSNINECIENTVKVVWNDIKYQNEIKMDLNELPEINSNIDELGQVFLNLIINANQAMEQGGIISIKTWQDSSFVYIKVSDSGCGISAEKINSIFDPFFTTKPVGVGTGLGLSIAHGIIEDHGGNISVESVIDQGTAFTIQLPTA